HLGPDAVADDDDEDRTEHHAGHRVQGLDVRSEDIGQQADAAEGGPEDDAEADTDEETKGRLLERRRDLQPKGSLRRAVLDPGPELRRDARRPSIEERVERAGLALRCAELPEAEHHDRDGDAQSVHQQPAPGPRLRPRAIAARRLGADEWATSRRA